MLNPYTTNLRTGFPVDLDNREKSWNLVIFNKILKKGMEPGKTGWSLSIQSLVSKRGCEILIASELLLISN